MVAYIRDNTGRFQQRPHYKPEELDRECEGIITSFLRELHGGVSYPIQTEDIKKLIETDVEDLDVYADLSHYGCNVEGVTEFRAGKRPHVLISSTLTENDRQENRLRTTLTHEYGHVRFHAYLWEMEPLTADLLRQKPDADKVICKRDTIMNAQQYDWMEWQAGYVCGALLMPKSAVIQTCKEYVEHHGIFGAVSQQTEHSSRLVEKIVEKFQVSQDAARIRLIKLNQLTPAASTKSLFG
ncbi:MAG: ImmA/IrrE family metallo-endopeptidase [Alphaproteobacteria bacterium]|nr:ImmA/IrrE family metallo-endopeptidase [Alphaproteobacteria bacterium]